jgi:excisionase family DNA binding protein
MKPLVSTGQELPTPVWLTQGEVASLLGVSVHTLLDWRRDGRGPQYTDMGGRAVRYLLSDVQTWLASLPSRGHTDVA